MKSILILLSLALASTAVARDKPRNAVAFWDTSKATEGNQTVTLPDEVSNNTLIALPEVNAKIGKGPVTGDKAIVFNGKQAEGAKAEKLIQIKDNVVLSLQAKIEEGENWQTLAYLYGVIELRYQRGAKELRLLTYHEKYSTPVEIGLPVDLNKWIKIKAEVDGSSIELTVDGKSVKGKIPGDRSLTPIPARFFLGYGDERPFCGAIADIGIGVSTN